MLIPGRIAILSIESVCRTEEYAMSLSAKKLLRTAGSIRAFFIISILLCVAMVAGTLAPQWDPYRTWWFMSLLVGLAINTVACVGLRYRSIRAHSLISHIGVLLILAGSTVTLLTGIKGTMVLKAGLDQLPVVKAADGDGINAWLPFKVKLDKFEIERYDGPEHTIQITHREEGWTEEHALIVGKPLLADHGGLTITPHAFNPDFYVDMEARQVGQRSNQPNNPAMLVTVKASPERPLWLFDRFPGMHQDELPFKIEYKYKQSQVKQYKSWVTISDTDGKVILKDTLWVNKPLRHAGYTFYQSSYDPDDPTVSILQVARDPGVPVVYYGFAVLMLGLGMGFFSNGRRHESA